MDCSKFKIISPKFLDNETGIISRIRIQRHLKKCPGCRSYYDGEKLVIEKLKKIPEINPPENLKKIIVSEFEKIKKPASDPIKLNCSRKPLKTIALACAAAGIIIGFGLASKTFELRSDSISSGTYVLAVNSDKGDLF